jgi:hypothetical protein
VSRRTTDALVSSLNASFPTHRGAGSEDSARRRAIVTPKALSEGIPYRAMPSRVRLLLWRSSQVITDLSSFTWNARYHGTQ